MDEDAFDQVVPRQVWRIARAVPGNYRRLQQICDALMVKWLRILPCRSQRGRRMTWDKFAHLGKPWLPPPHRIVRISAIVPLPHRHIAFI